MSTTVIGLLVQYWDTLTQIRDREVWDGRLGSYRKEKNHSTVQG